MNTEMNESVRHSDNANERELTLGFQDCENLVTGDESDLRDPMGRISRSVRPLRASFPVVHE